MTNYLRTLPLHHSQKEISTTNDYSDYEYFVVPTFDFRQAILKEGSELEVLEPQSFRDEIKEELTKTINRYKNKNKTKFEKSKNIINFAYLFRNTNKTYNNESTRIS